MELESSENAALVELLATISDRRIRRKVHKFLQHGEEAVRALGELDTTLHETEEGELQIVADAVLSHFRRLLEYTSMVFPSADVGSVDPGELELDGTLAPTASKAPSRSVIAHRERSDEDRWTALATEMAVLQYGLESELKEFERRFAHALENDKTEQAIRDLNDATTGLMDGVFAVMTTVYECFLGYAEPERMVPGHRDTLGKALAVRRALAHLRREVRDLNREVQKRLARLDLAERNYQRIVELASAFIDSDVFNYLRSDTRRDFWELRETLAQGSATRNRLDCEGFDKYLDSLSFISQRGVLLKHDADLKTKISGDLVRAIKFAAVLPEIASDVIAEAFIKAERLFGLDDEIDRLVLEWASLEPTRRADLEHVVALGRELLGRVA